MDFVMVFVIIFVRFQNDLLAEFIFRRADILGVVTWESVSGGTDYVSSATQVMDCSKADNKGATWMTRLCKLQDVQ
jgi:hypothetical protein